MVRKPEALIPTRYSLLSRLYNWDDQESWKEFFETYWRLIYAVAIKAGLSEQEAQDVVQETVICVAKEIQNFKKDRTFGSFKGWLRNITRWRIGDQFRKRSLALVKEPRIDYDSNSIAPLEDIADSAASPLEAEWDQEWRQNLFDVAVERVKRRVKEEHYQIFDLHVVKQWPVSKVAKTLGVSVARVYLVKHRVSLLLRKEIRLLEKKEF